VTRLRSGAAVVALALVVPALTPVAAAAAVAPVTHGPATVNGLAVALWTWIDSQGMPRTVALKKEGHGNPGHGGYAVQMTYFAQLVPGGGFQKITVNAETPGAVDPNKDGGFGYFVSHERYRLFKDGAVDTIASHIFGTDDSPLGRRFAPTVAIPAVPAGFGIEAFTIVYGHYGTLVPHPVDPQTGLEKKPLPLAAAAYQFYALPVTTSWVFETGRDYPRIHVVVDLSQVVPAGGTAPLADLVSFDLRGPYGVMVFDDGADGVVDNALWGDQQYLFSILTSPPTRGAPWDWSAANPGARFNALVAGGFEMGLYEPHPAALSTLADGYAAERGFTSSSYAGQGGTSQDSCPSADLQTLPSDGDWPYQSIQYSLPCPQGDPNFLTDPAYGKKLAWGSSSYYGTSLTAVYNGQASLPIQAWPANHLLNYNVCLVLGQPGSGPSLTAAAAAAYTQADPNPATSNCAGKPPG
jgi:hypothetical protein